MESKKLLLGDIVTTYGEGKAKDKNNTLLFLHGWMQDKDSFDDICRLLDKENISYISLDLPGFGGTSLVSSDMHIEDYGKFVQDFIEKKELIKPILVGHSFGGRISIYLGSFYTNISSIVLLGAAGIAPTMNPVKLAIVKTGKLLLSLPGLRKIGNKVKSAISAPDYKNAENMTQIYRNAIGNDLQHYMRKVSYPVLMIWGDTDDQVTTEQAKIMHTHMKNSQLHILPGTHFVHQEKVPEITKLVLDFIRT